MADSSARANCSAVCQVSYFAINTTAISEGSFQNNLLDPTVNGQPNPDWLGNLTPSQFNTKVTALTPQIDWETDAISNGGGPAGNTGPSFQPYASIGGTTTSRPAGSAIPAVPGTSSTPVPVNFETESDDGSVTYIDGKLVVNNDFFQGETFRTGLVNLTPGPHAIDIEYLPGRRRRLRCRVLGPDGRHQLCGHSLHGALDSDAEHRHPGMGPAR